VIRLEFGRKSAADDARDAYREHLHSEDDRRLKTVRFTDELPAEDERELETQAAADRAEKQASYRQTDLTRGEKQRFDLSRDGLNVFKLRSIKGMAQAEGLEDWTAHVDPTLTTSEHKEVIERAAQQQTGADGDRERSDEQRAHDLAAQAGGGDCDHARGHCRHGDPEACEFLAGECGFSEEEVEQLMSDMEPQEPDSGQLTFQDLTGAEKGALSRSWNGYKAAVAVLDRHLADVAEAFAHAEQAAAAISNIEGNLPDGTEEFRRLRQHHDTLAELAEEHVGGRWADGRADLDSADDPDAITTRPTAAEETAEEATVRGGASDPAAGLTHAESGDNNA